MKPRRRYAGSPDITAVDFIVITISTYRDDLRALDAEAARRKTSRSALIRQAVREMLERGE